MNSQLFIEISSEINNLFLKKSLIDMVSIKSENPFDEEPRSGYREKEMGEYLLDAMDNLGLEVSINHVCPGRPNVFGMLKGAKEGPTLMLAGHMDTARTDGYNNAYDVHEQKGCIYGRGSCDMKAGLAAYLEVARLIKEAGIKLSGNLIIAGIMDEEYKMLGSKHIGQNGPTADQGIIGEPTDLAICPSNKGRVSTFIRTYGKAAHSSVPEKGNNAISHMAEVIQAFNNYNQTLKQSPPHHLCGHGRFNIGVISGGVQVNMVPDFCELEVDRRTLPGETKEMIYKELRSRIDPLVKKIPDFTYDLSDPSWLIPPNDISIEEPVVTSLLKAHHEITGNTTTPKAFVAGSDAPYIGCPTVVCGPGSIAQAHSTCEYVSFKQISIAAQMYLWTALELLGQNH